MMGFQIGIIFLIKLLRFDLFIISCQMARRGKEIVVKRRYILFQVLIIIISVFHLSVQAEEIDMHIMEVGYKDYIASIDNKVRPDIEINVPIFKYTETDMESITIREDLSGKKALTTDEDGYVEWEVNVPESGLYNIQLEYYPLEGKGGIIEREIQINGKLPFAGAKFLEFTRVWQDEHDYRIDNQGNHIRSPQIEVPIWQTAVLSDSMGYVQEPYLFYFNKGINTIRLLSRREPMALSRIRIFRNQAPDNYQEVNKDYQDRGIEETGGTLIKVQGEDAVYRSSKTLYPTHDQGDATVEPNHPAQIRLNTIGGHNWNLPGQWVEWKVDVPESGLYKIGIKAKQNIRSGTFTNRRLYVNGEVPFQEVNALRFNYSNFYQMFVPSEVDGEEYLFYLEKGENSIRLETVLGDLAEMIERSTDVLYDLSTIYRRVIMITSREPDILRTYNLPEKIPGLADELREQSAVLKQLALTMTEFTGEQGEHTALLNNLSHQLEHLAEKPDDRMPRSLKGLRDNIAALGEWIMRTNEQPLQIDYLMVASPEEKLPQVRPTALQFAGHEVKSFLYSFIYDYSQVGDVYEEEKNDIKPLKVWIGGGRDQAQTLKNMIEDSFTPQTGIPVNLELIQQGVILPATLAGKGPDVALSVSPAVPINFFIRGAIVDLAEFDDFPEVASRFKQSALVSFQFRDSFFALPEQQIFPVMFYRKDILNDMGLSVPQTWDEVFHVIAELQKSNMDFGIPYSDIQQIAVGGIGEGVAGAGSITSHIGVINMLTFMYQNNVELYKEDGIETNIDTESAIEAFIKWTELYELYDIPQWFDYVNYFRMGDMPLMIQGYTMRNHLEVFAPELRGKWGFTLVPGTVQEDGSLNRTVPAMGYNTGHMAHGPGAFIMEAADDKEAAWEFLKWWTSTETQVRFGHELESIMGTAARYPTANVDALQQLPWRLEELEVLNKQWDYVKGLPEVPGGYMVGRHLDFAFRRVIDDEHPPRETLLDYNRIMNLEIDSKREEFDIETDIEDLPPENRILYWNYGVEDLDL
ncbi:MAG: extracellular solute-binding protein [Halanaerobiales bacterium]